MNDRNRKVWSSEGGRIDQKPATGPQRPRGDGRVRITRETKGRRGKTVTVVGGLDLDPEELAALAADLKKKCGVGGSAKDGLITIQGDKQEAVAAVLRARGLMP